MAACWSLWGLSCILSCTGQSPVGVLLACYVLMGLGVLESFEEIIIFLKKAHRLLL